MTESALVLYDYQIKPSVTWIWRAPDPIDDERERIRRRVRLRLRHLEKRLDAEPESDQVWTQYLLAAMAWLASERTSEALLTTEELARSLNVSPETVRDRVKAGRLQPAAMFGRRGGFRFRQGSRPT